MPLSACPADLLSYAGLVLCVVLTPASLRFSPTHCNYRTVCSNDYFRITQSQNPLGCCLNWKFIFNSFAAHTVCMNHFASLVPNHEYWCRAHCHCLCFSELSFLIISAICKKRSHTSLLALHCNPRFVFCGGHFLDAAITPAPRSKWIMINHMRLNVLCKAFLVQTHPAHQRYHHPPCFQGPRARDCFKSHVLESPVLQADTRPPERITSHDSHRPIRVSDCSVVFGYCSCSSLCADFLNRFVQYSVGSLQWLQLHRQIPSARCRCELNLLPCSRIKTETLPLWSKTNPSTTICHLSDSHQRSSTIDFSIFDGHWLSGLI